MSYISVLPLAAVKVYLRIDDTQNETDAEITAMINSSLSYIEKATNHIMFPRDIEYFYDDCMVRVYDHPINSTTNTTATRTKKSLYSIYKESTDLDSITINVGYALATDVPSELLEAAKQMIKVWYFEAEKQANTTLIPESVKEAINANKRFIL